MPPRDGLSAIRGNAVPHVPRTVRHDHAVVLPAVSPAWDAVTAATPATAHNLGDLVRRALGRVADPPEQDELALLDTDGHALAHLREMLRNGVPRTPACRLAGLNPRQVAGWLVDCTEPLPPTAPPLQQARRRAVQTVVDVLQGAEAELVAELSLGVVARAREGDVKVAMWALERRGGAAWNRPSVVKHEGRTVHDHRHLHGHTLLNPATLSDRQLLQVQEMLALGTAVPAPSADEDGGTAAPAPSADEDDGG